MSRVIVQVVSDISAVSMLLKPLESDSEKGGEGNLLRILIGQMGCNPLACHSDFML